MKHVKTLSLLFAASLFVACGNDSDEKNDPAPEEQVAIAEVVPNATSTLEVEGMTCEMGCKAAIEKHLSKTAGVASCDVDFENALAVVEYDNKVITEEQIIAEIGSIANESYSAKPHAEEALSE
jgi:mercuric ion binding protein